MNTKSTQARPDTVLLCRGRSCCPEVAFGEDRTLRLRADDGTTIELSVEQAEILAQTLVERGYAT